MAALDHVIAIDGPVAAGKTVVGRLLACRLGYRFLDTGVMYRAVTWLAQQRGVPMADESALGRLAQENPVELAGRASDRVTIAGYELAGELRDPEIDRRVSLVARLSPVRRALVEQQKNLAAQGRLVMVGRDIANVVLPDAPVKIYMTAPAEERSRRRHQDLIRQGHQVDFEQVLEETRRRDEIDSQRTDSPLRPAAGAQVIDTARRTIDQVVELILALVRQRCGIAEA